MNPAAACGVGCGARRSRFIANGVLQQFGHDIWIAGGTEPCGRRVSLSDPDGHRQAGGRCPFHLVAGPVDRANAGRRRRTRPGQAHRGAQLAASFVPREWKHMARQSKRMRRHSCAAPSRGCRRDDFIADVASLRINRLSGNAAANAAFRAGSAGGGSMARRIRPYPRSLRPTGAWSRATTAPSRS